MRIDARNVMSDSSAAKALAAARAQLDAASHTYQTQTSAATPARRLPLHRLPPLNKAAATSLPLVLSNN